jgi:hypothetical protein
MLLLVGDNRVLDLLAKVETQMILEMIGWEFVSARTHPHRYSGENAKQYETEYAH